MNSRAVRPLDFQPAGGRGETPATLFSAFVCDEPPPAAQDLGREPWERAVIEACREQGFLGRTEQTCRDWAVRFGHAALLRLPEGDRVEWLKQLAAGLNFAHWLATSAADLGRKLADYRKRIAPDGAVWVSWPKKASTAPTDITEDVIRDVALPLGFVAARSAPWTRFGPA